ncbi:MAG: hypothetical protein K9H48_14170 [Melioribacteraceae bacterium]|nr:hypothetical protein [Melioribacteraceae bacterium]MCF8395097.1 hypothetical protein [Melioribacteraceae bacterium]MCF8420506.1 hypothetical protein [Melioribacteraceae bacterium]
MKQLSYEKLVEIRELVKKHNISAGLLSVVSGLKRTRVVQVLKGNHHTVAEDTYKILKATINTIISEENVYDKYIRGDVIPKKEPPNNPNLTEIRQYLRQHKISRRKAALICGYNPYSFAGYFTVTKKYDISESKKNEIMDKLKEYVDSKLKK